MQSALRKPLPLVAGWLTVCQNWRSDSTRPISWPAALIKASSRCSYAETPQDNGFPAELKDVSTGSAALRERYRQLASESAESVANPAMAAYSKKKLFKKERHHIDKDRHAVVLVGLTGAGKSSTGNTLCGARKAFVQGSSVASVTASVSVRDYQFEGRKWRVIDTPGFGDTSMDEGKIEKELHELFKYAKYGIACVVIVVKKGRFTREQEQIVLKILDFFGGDGVLPHCILAVTNCTDPQEKLLDDIGKLEMDHALRRLAAMVDDRVLPIENIREPAKATCRLLLHHGILEILDSNDGQTYTATDIKSRSDLRALSSAGVLWQSEPGNEQATLPDGTRCSFSWDPAMRRLTTVCDFPPPP